MAASNIDIISQRQQARKSYFYDEEGTRKTKNQEVQREVPKAQTPDYTVNISDTARNAAVQQAATGVSASDASSTSQSPNATRLAELRAQSDAVMSKYAPAQETVEADSLEVTEESAQVETAETSEAAQPAGDFLSQRQAARQDYFGREPAQEFTYNRNTDLDALKAQSDAIINRTNGEGA